MDFVNAILHGSVFLALLVPIGVLFGTLKCYKGKFASVFAWLIAALAPMAVFHLLESLGFFGIELIPEEIEMGAEHLVAVIAVLGVAGFLNWFNTEYVAPFCKIGAKKKD